jgi:hypothetical protein
MPVHVYHICMYIHVCVYVCVCVCVCTYIHTYIYMQPVDIATTTPRQTGTWETTVNICMRKSLGRGEGELEWVVPGVGQKPSEAELQEMIKEVFFYRILLIVDTHLRETLRLYQGSAKVLFRLCSGCV